MTNPGVGGLTAPVITNIYYTDSSYTNLDDTAVSITGGYVKILGSGFGVGFSLYLNGVVVSQSNTTFVSSTEIRAQLPATSLGTYSLMLFNGNNAGVISPNGVFFSPFPTYGTPIAVAVINNVSFSQQLGAAGDAPLVYTVISGSLPTGVTLSSSGVLGGTPTGYSSNQTFNFTIQVNDAQLQTITQAISLTVSVGDSYWSYTSLLLNGDTTVVSPTFINDSSLNNLQLTIAGDTKPTLFTPYQGNYYSSSFGTKTDYVSVPATSNLITFTGDFTFEAWIYPTDTSISYWKIFDSRQSGATGVAMVLGLEPLASPVTGQGRLDYYNGGHNYGTGIVYYYQWTHIAFVRSSSTMTFYINGVAGGTATVSGTQTGAATTNPIYIAGTKDGGSASYGVVGNIKDLRVVNGSAVYTSNFTPPTQPLTSITNTVLLTYQSNKFIDNSPYNATLTASGTATISTAIPFTTPTSVTVNTGSSVHFNGSTAFLDSPSTTQFVFGNATSFAIEAWVYPLGYNQSGSGPPDKGTIWSCGVAEAGSTRPLFGINSSGKLVFGGWNTLTATGTTTVPLNAWSHVAVTFDGTTYRLFYNGAVDGTSTSILNFSTTPVTGTVGGNPDTTYRYPYYGYISNLRVVKGSSVYISAFTPSTTSLTAITNTVLLTCQGSQVIDASANAFTLTPSGTPKVVNNAYPFTQTTQTVSNLNTLGSAYFDGTGDYLTAPYSTNWDWASTNYTIDVWCHPTVLSTYNPLVAKEISTGNNDWELYINSSGTVTFRYWNGSAPTFGTTNTVIRNAWNHVAFVNNSSALSIYINGILSASATISGTPSTSASVPLQIGTTYGGISGASSAYFTGYISEVRVTKGTALYNSNFLPTYQPLTAIANTQLLTCQYNSGANNYGIYDNSTFNNIITRFGNTAQGTFSPYSQTGWSYYFGGTGNYLSTAATILPATQNTFTIEGWIYMTATPVTGGSPAQPALIGDMQAAAGTMWWAFGPLAAGTLSFFWNDGTGKSAVGNTVMSLNTWYHVAISVSSNTISMYVNGLLQTLTGTTTLTNRGGTLTSTVMGTYSTAGSQFIGYASNIRMVPGTALYPSAFTPTTTPLTPITGSGLMTCQSNRIIDNSLNNYALTITGSLSVQSFSPFGSIREAVPLSYSNLFNGTSDYYTGPSNTALITTGQFTIECWIYPTAFSVDRMIFENAHWDIGQNGGFRVQLKSTGAVNLTASPGSYNSYPDVFISTGTVSLNTWSHVAITRDSGNLIYCFINGVSAVTPVSRTTSLSLTSDGNIGVAKIGATISDGGSNNFFSGYISNLRLIQGTALYTSAFTPPTSPLTSVSGTVFLSCQSAIMADKSSSAYTLTAVGTPKIYKYNPFGYTAQSITNYTPSIHGGSAYFDGTGDKLTIASYPTLAFLANDFTIQCWFYCTNVSTEQTIMTNGWSAYAPWLIRINNASTLMINMSLDGGSWFVNEVSLGAVVSNQWYHVAACRVSGTLRVFVNGVQQYTTSVGSLYNGSQAVYIGGRSDTVTPFIGYISDCQLINGIGLYKSNFVPPIAPATPSLQTTLLLNFTGGGIVDQHSSNVLETVGNTQLASEDPYSGSYYSNYFNGTTDYLSIVEPAGTTGDLTMEFWVYPNTFTPSTQMIICNTTSAAGCFGFELASATGGNIKVYIDSFSGPTTSSLALNLSSWNHVALVRSAGVFSLYINGTKDSYTKTSSGVFGRGGTIVVGRYSGGTEYFQGYVSNFRWVQGTAQYSGSTITAPTLPLTAITNTALLTCQSNKFVDNSANALTITLAGTPQVKSKNPFQQNTVKSIYFDGTGDYLTTPTNALNNFGTGDFTVEAWVYPNSLATDWFIISASGSGGFFFGYSSTTTLGYGWGRTGTAWDYRVAGNATVGVWQHVAVTRSGTSMRLFVNGTQSGTTQTLATAYDMSLTSTTIGSQGANYYLNGYIKDLRVTKGYARYTGAFSPPIQQLSTK